MSRNRIIYNTEAVYVGPAPDTNPHFIDYSGNFYNTFNTSNIANLVKHIPRVQSFSYSLNLQRENVLNLGRRSTVRQSIFEPPQINLNFDYLQVGVLNEARLGFWTNYPRNYSPYDGEPYYTNNFSVLSIGGFLNRTDERENNPIGWPYLYRDKRNIFVALNNNQTDLKTQNTTYYEVDPNAVNWSVYCFGGCQLTSYSASAAVGDLPKVSVGFVADNMSFVLSGSGASIPAVDTKTFTGLNHLKFALPSPVDGTLLPSVLLPGDITIDITSKTQLTGISTIPKANYNGNQTNYNSIYSLGASFSDIKIQSYNINLDFERRDLKSIGYRLPVDRVIEFPLFVNTSVSALVGDIETGNINKLIQENADFDLTIKLKNPIGEGEASNAIAVQYDLRGSKLDGYEYNSAIGSNKQVTFNFITEIDPDDLRYKGFFMSGLMNTDSNGSSQISYNEWVTESSENVVTELGENVVVDSYVIFY